MSLPPINAPEDDGTEGLLASDTPALDAPAPPLRRVPNLGHAIIFVALTGLLLILSELIIVVLGHFPATPQAAAQHPKLQICAEAVAYLVTLAAAWVFFPLLWHRSFLNGLQWHWSVARDQAAKLVGLGLFLGVMMQLVTSFITPPKTMPIDSFFATALDAWLITFFGTVVAPIFEEICFRGFLVPAFAIAYDWLSLPRTDEARTRWQTTSTLSPDGLLFSAILTSLLFAGIHASQVAHLWVALVVLFSISLVLTWVRIKTQSVAASTLVHAAYNGFVFVMTFIATGGFRHLDRMTH